MPSNSYKRKYGASQPQGGPCSERDSRKRQKRGGGAPSGPIRGQGIWFSCARRKEEQARADIASILDEVLPVLYPERALEDAEPHGDDQAIAKEAIPRDVESELQAELNALRSGNDQSNTESSKDPDGSIPRKTGYALADPGPHSECLGYVVLHSDLDPYRVAKHILSSAVESGESKSRFIQRLTPVSATELHTTSEKLERLSKLVLSKTMPSPDSSADPPVPPLTYKIDTRRRAQFPLESEPVIKIVAACVPDGHTVDLKKPDRWIVLETMSRVASVGVLSDYEALCKYNYQTCLQKAREKSGAGTGDSRPANDTVEHRKTPDL